MAIETSYAPIYKYYTAKTVKIKKKIKIGYLGRIDKIVKIYKIGIIL